MSKGLFCVFDGVDGSGKTTLTLNYMAEMRAKGYNVKQFRAIGEGLFGAAIRNIVLNFEAGTRPNPISEALAFIAAIEECYYNHVKPWVEDGNIAVMDRCVYSTFVYQGLHCQDHKPDVGGLMWNDMVNLISKMSKPDISVICEVYVPTARENIAARGNPNSLDKYCNDNLREMVERYDRLQSEECFSDHNFWYVDNNRPYPKPQTQLDGVIEESLRLIKEKTT